MHFETIQAISVNGTAGKPNDDRLGGTSRLGWVIDGATDLGPPGLLGDRGGAAWLAAEASAAFARAEEPRLPATCNRAFAAIEQAFHAARTREVQEAWELPRAAFVAVQLADGMLDVAWAADCSVLHATRNAILWPAGEPDSGTEAAEAEALGAGVGALERRDGAVLDDRRAHRSRVDHKTLSALAERSRAATQHATGAVFPGDDILLMSDGFTRLVSDYRRHSAETLVEAMRSRGLHGLVNELREIEREDAACLRYPRFKVSDDATALWLRVAG